MCTNARMMLSVQRGPCWAANSSSLYELLAKEGAIEGVVEYDQGKGRGSFVFHDEEVAAKLQFRSRELPSHNPEEVVTVFLWRHLELLPDEAMSTLLLLEAAWLPTGWGSKINIRIYFEQFCPVEGVLYLPNRGSLRRVVVAFPCPKVVTALLAMEARKPHMIVSQNIRLLPLTGATLNPVINVNTDNEIVPTGAAGAAGVAEAATTNSGEAVHKSSNCGDVVNVNNNTKRKSNNKNTDVVKNLPQSQVKNNNCETSG